MNPPKQTTVQPAGSGSLVPDIVTDIPMAAPNTASKPANEDDELDKIMRDVGKDLNQVGKKNKQHGFLGFGHKTNKQKAEPKFSARPIDQVKAIPAGPPAPAKPAAPGPPAKPAAKPDGKPLAAPKPATQSSAPVTVIILALLVTAALSAAAYYAYQ